MMEQKNNWTALIALALAMLVVGLDVTILNVALPTIAANLEASTSELQWIVNAYVLAYAGAMLPAGVLGDRLGRKAVLLAGLGVFLVSSVGAAVTDSVDMLIAMRAAMGIGAAVITPIVIAMIPIMFGDADRPKAVGAITAATSLGLPLGPIIAGYLLDRFAWSSIFWINVPVVAIAFVAALALIGESRDARAPRLDIPGTIAVVLGIVLLVYGLVEAPKQGWTSGETLVWVGSGVGLLAAFVTWQTRAPRPLVDLRLFRDARFTGGTISMVLLMFVMYGLLFTLPLYLQAVRGNDALGTGLRLTPMMAGILVSAGISKRLLAGLGARVGVVAGMLISAGSMAALTRISVDTPMVWIGIGLAAFGLGMGVAMTSGMDAILASLPHDAVGAGSGVASALRQVAGALGVAVLGSVLSSVYTENLDSGMLRQLPDGASGSVQDSIVGANLVANALGASGEPIRQMASVSFTDAMAVVLGISALAGIVAAVISGAVLPGRRESVASSKRVPEPTPFAGAATAQE